MLLFKVNHDEQQWYARGGDQPDGGAGKAGSVRRTASYSPLSSNSTRLTQVSLKTRTTAGIVIIFFALVGNGLLSYHATNSMVDREQWVSHTDHVLSELEATLSSLKDAETGERGFVITGDDTFLEPYQSAMDQIDGHVQAVARLTADNPSQQARIPVLKSKIASCLHALKTGIDLRRAGDADASRRVIASGVGKQMMDDLRRYIDGMEDAEKDLLKQRTEESLTTVRNTYVTLIAATAAGCGLLLLVGYVTVGGITARQRAEDALFEQHQLLHVTLSSIGDAVIATDIRGLVTFLNPVAEELTGWSKEQAAQQPIQKVFHIVNEGTRTAVENPALRAMKEGTIVGLANHTLLIRKDGTQIPIDDSGAPIKNVAGATLGAVLVFRDITQRRQAENELARLFKAEQEAHEQADAASRAKDQFLALVSHELRTPLSAILGWTHLVRTGKVDAKEPSRALAAIERNAQAQAKLIEDLLDTSRIISGKLSLDFSPVELAPVIESAIEAVRPSVVAKSIELEVDLSEDSDLVSGDAGRLQQVVWNLLANAVKFTPAHGRIEVRLRRSDSRLELSVTDSGMGIDGGFLPFVFNRFSQAAIAPAQKYGGLGLGLSIARQLVEAHGGTIRAESPGLGQGTTFTVTMPVRALRDPLDKRVSGEDRIHQLAGALRLEGLRVMVIDDQEEIRDLLMILLEQRGAEVRACGSTAEALNTLESWMPSILISDVAMPGEDGYTFVKKLRSLEGEPASIPAIALTARANVDDRLEALAAGFQQYLAKPVEADELVLVVASLAGRLGGRVFG